MVAKFAYRNRHRFKYLWRLFYLPNY